MTSVGHTLTSGMIAIGLRPPSSPSICMLGPVQPRVRSCSTPPSDARLSTACETVVFNPQSWALVWLT